MGQIIIGSDHAGFPLKEIVKQYVAEMGYVVTDAGTDSAASVDYPDFGAIVAQRVSTGEFDRGILVCGSGVGMSIVANKFPGVRAALCLDEETARMSRLHNDANILVLAGRRTEKEAAKSIVRLWLNTEFEGGRHQGRLDKIADIGKRLYK
ncbi:MAG: ribose 5-phosphate isomerase B [Syntrophales bacterium]|jgi:ribose 5-phosphate isomerase B